MKEKKIACIIVTYNRKELLKRCLDAVATQTYRPHTVYIMDNASTDGTIDSVKEWGFYECEYNGIRFKYILNSCNEGGAGGFYLGMKTAYDEGGYDGIWVMDDDGLPEKNCLQSLVPHLQNYDYIAPLVVDIEDGSNLSFNLYRGISDRNEIVGKYSKHGIVYDYACPFNGILYSADLIKLVGFPNKDLFIWGDEMDYHFRSKDAGFMPVTVIDAIHRHPADRAQFGTSLFGAKVFYVDQLWKMYCWYRNQVYIHSKEWGRTRWTTFILYPLYFFLIKQRSIKKTLCFINAVRDGYNHDFTKLSKYKK